MKIFLRCIWSFQHFYNDISPQALQWVSLLGGNIFRWTLCYLHYQMWEVSSLRYASHLGFIFQWIYGYWIRHINSEYGSISIITLYQIWMRHIIFMIQYVKWNDVVDLVLIISSLCNRERKTFSLSTKFLYPIHLIKVTFCVTDYLGI